MEVLVVIIILFIGYILIETLGVAGEIMSYIFGSCLGCLIPIIVIIFIIGLLFGC